MTTAARIDHGGDAAEGRAGGFTLVELLTVMAIVAVVFGVAIGSVARAGKAGALEGAARTARSHLMRARMLAMSDGALSRVVFTPAEPEARVRAGLTVEFTRVAGNWHFDDPPGFKAAAGGMIFSNVLGGAFIANGTLRGGVQLTQAARIVSPPLTQAPTFDPTRGFSLRLDVAPEAAGLVARVGEPTGGKTAFLLRIEEDGSVAAELETIFDAEHESKTKRDRMVKLKTKPRVLELGVWTRLGLTYDGVTAAIEVAGVVEAVVAETRDLDVPPNGALVFGAGFSGLLDEAEYLTTSAPETTFFEGGVDVETQAPVVVRFGRDGRLNDRVHTEPVTTTFVLEGRRETVTADLSGVLR